MKKRKKKRDREKEKKSERGKYEVDGGKSLFFKCGIYLDYILFN